MIRTLFEDLANTWPREIEWLAHYLALAWPVLAVCVFVLVFAIAGQWLIDRCTLPRPPTPTVWPRHNRRGDLADQELWKRRPGFEPTYPARIDEPRPPKGQP